MGVQLTEEMISGAQETEKKYGIPTSITLAQILQESGGSYVGGLSGLAFKAKNLFGIKGTGSAGSVSMQTTEYDSSGKAYKTYANFRRYNTFSESIEDHGKLLTNSRYTKYTSNAKSLEEYAQGIQKGGYATDPNYASSLMKMISDNNLSQYDVGTWQSGGSTSGNIATGTQMSTNNSGGEDIRLKLWGNIALFICVILVVGGAILFFIKAFDISLSPQKQMLKSLNSSKETNTTTEYDNGKDGKSKSTETKKNQKIKKGGKKSGN